MLKFILKPLANRRSSALPSEPMLAVIFGEIIVKRRQDFLLDLTHGKGKVDRFPGDLSIWIVIRIDHRNRLLLAHL